MPRLARLSAALDDIPEDRPVRLAAGVLAVGRFIGVAVQVQVAELVDLPELHAAKAAEERFGLIRVLALRPYVVLRMVNALHLVLGVQRVIGAALIGADDRIGRCRAWRRTRLRIPRSLTERWQ